MADLDAILARLERLERLEAENEALRSRLDALDRPTSADDSAASGRVSRRSLLRRAGTSAAALGVGALGASMATLAQAAPVRASDGQTLTVGGTFDASSPTQIHNVSNANSVLVVNSTSGGAVEGNSSTSTGVRGTSDSGTGAFGNSSTGTGALGKSTTGIGVHGQSGSGDGVRGESLSGPGVHGIASGDDAILGETVDGNGVNGTASGAGTAVRGSSATGYGMYGQSTSLIGVSGFSNNGIGAQGAGRDIGTVGASVSGPNTGQGTGVLGISGFSTFPARSTRTDIGVLGISAHGRGGVFTGPRAPIRLTPSSAGSHPASGSRGDFFVDSVGRLWFCKGGTTWVKLA